MPGCSSATAVSRSASSRTEITERRRIGGTIDVRALQRAIRPMPAPERRPAAGLVLPSVTVVLCTDGAAGTTMRSVLANRYPDFDVVVVSRGADDEGVATVDIGGRRVTTIAAPSEGLAAARNAGLLAASGEVVAFVDEGAVVDGDWVDAVARAFAAADDVDCVTGLVPSAELRTPAQRWHDAHTPGARTVRRRVFRARRRGGRPAAAPLRRRRVRHRREPRRPPCGRALDRWVRHRLRSRHQRRWRRRPRPLHTTAVRRIQRSPSNRPPSRGSDRRTTSRRSARPPLPTATDSEPG
ncbi:glycosyltransferase family A protein [Curtobacterium flaccumfaciens]|nr:glycosyltransferase family A protein [Curtobacterium flaccumfaciens]